MNSIYKIIIMCLLIFYITTEITQGELNKSDFRDGIDHYIFYRSVPPQMKMGKSYNVEIFVNNNDNFSKSYRILFSTSNVSFGIVSPGGKNYRDFIYPRHKLIYFDIEAGGTQRIEVPITPTQPYIGEIEVSAELYSGRSDEYYPTDMVLIDTVSTKVYSIEPAFTKEELILFCVFIVIISVIIHKIIISRNTKN